MYFLMKCLFENFLFSVFYMSRIIAKTTCYLAAFNNALFDLLSRPVPHFISRLDFIGDEFYAHCIVLTCLNIQFYFGKLAAYLNFAIVELRIIHRAL